MAQVRSKKEMMTSVVMHHGHILAKLRLQMGNSHSQRMSLLWCCYSIPDSGGCLQIVDILMGLLASRTVEAS